MNNQEDWEDDFRTQYDELTKKKESMKGMNRELVIDYFRKLLASERRKTREETLKEAERLIWRPKQSNESGDGRGYNEYRRLAGQSLVRAYTDYRCEHDWEMTTKPEIRNIQCCKKCPSLRSPDSSSK